ncbi:DUF3999 family protein [Caenimonas koreensis]|uniref:DUF3999 family protein n=1 Tax=Caenimonas koreensis TaxID=367474 RepID=UPI0037850E08
MTHPFFRLAFALAALCMAGQLHAQSNAQPPQPSQFAWRAPVELPANASLARVALPAPALMRMQSADARDVRVFNAAGEAVAFAVIGAGPAAAAPATRTGMLPAMPLFSAAAGAADRPRKGAMKVRIADADRSVWVQIDGQLPLDPNASKINSVIVDLRAQAKPLSAIVVHGTLPLNAPVQVTASTSADLASWIDLPVRGRLYRFEPAGAPSNDTLEFESPATLERRYLRLDWAGQEGVAVTAIEGVIASATPAPERAHGDLPAARVENKGLEFQLGFATPVAALTLATPRANTLLPVRVLARNEVSQPWRVIAQTVVYRVGEAGKDVTNSALPLNGVSARWLRVESVNGVDLSASPLSATVQFDPVQLVFVATGSPPFELAVGRAATAAAALPAGMLAGTLGGKRLDEVALATLGAAVVSSPSEASGGFLDRLRPEGVSQRAALLWAVLLGGVLLLGGVGWTLMRQLKR